MGRAPWSAADALVGSSGNTQRGSERSRNQAMKGMERMLSWQTLFEPAEEGGFVVTFPDLGHGATQGETEDEAMEMAADFLSCVVSDYIASGDALPEPK